MPTYIVLFLYLIRKRYTRARNVSIRQSLYIHSYVMCCLSRFRHNGTGLLRRTGLRKTVCKTT